jgi:hypothetical protein
MPPPMLKRQLIPYSVTAFDEENETTEDADKGAASGAPYLADTREGKPSLARWVP